MVIYLYPYQWVGVYLFNKENSLSKEIPLTRGQVAIVDDDDYDYLMQWKWYAEYNSTYGHYYATRTRKVSEKPGSKSIRMHRAIVNCPDNLEVDHANHNTLDNRKSNLRVVTKSENLRNRNVQSNNTSGYKGVIFHAGRYRATIKVNRKNINLGRFDTIEEAAEAYKRAALRYHGEFACLDY